MATDIAEQPMTYQRILDESAAEREVAREVARRDVRHVVLVARGTSDHAALYGSYLSQIRLGLAAGLASPSVVSLYGAQGGGGFPGGGGQPGGGSQPAGGAATATTGMVKMVDGTTLYVQTADGSVLTVRTGGDTAVKIAKDGSLKELKAGDTVTVEGANSAGTVTATSVTGQAR